MLPMLLPPLPLPLLPPLVGSRSSRRDAVTR